MWKMSVEWLIGNRLEKDRYLFKEHLVACHFQSIKTQAIKKKKKK